jgi:hypothetical protein
LARVTEVLGENLPQHHVGFVVEKMALGQVFSELPVPIFIPPISPQSLSPSPIIRGWYSSGRSTQNPATQI